MSSIDIFGNVLDAETLEHALVETLKRWMPDHLKHQERRVEASGRPLPTAGGLPIPRTWTVLSEFDLEGQTALPAVVIESAGSVGRPVPNQKGERRKTWRFEVAIVIGGKNETEARRLASLELAAIIGALEQNQTLGGVVKQCVNVGPDDHAYGTTPGGKRRAIYGTAFEVTVRNFVNSRLGPDEPSEDPDNPGDPLPNPDTVDIRVEYLEETP